MDSPSPPGSLGKIKMRNRDIDASATRIQDETNDNFKLRQVEEDPLVKENDTARNQTGPNSPADEDEDSYTEPAPTQPRRPESQEPKIALSSNNADFGS